MRFRKRNPMEVCQNCENSNNKKGKWIHTWKRRGIRFDIIKDKLIKIPSKGYWHIFCEKKQKYYPWDYKKKCFKMSKGLKNE